MICSHITLFFALDHIFSNIKFGQFLNIYNKIEFELCVKTCAVHFSDSKIMNMISEQIAFISVHRQLPS